MRINERKMKKHPLGEEGWSKNKNEIRREILPDAYAYAFVIVVFLGSFVVV